ncbi:MAG: hypothetical protein J6I80_00665, partial [Clostridia bacterium]|nr:hypothetical protein [Clostridia bacterium]
NVPFLQLDTNKGVLKLMHGASEGMTEYTEKQVIISSNDILKKANIENSPFTVTIAPYDAENYLVAIDVAGDAVAGVMSKANLACTYQPSTTQGVFYMSVGGIDNNPNANNKWSLNYYGYKMLDSTYTAPAVSPVVPDGPNYAVLVENKATASLNGMTTNAASISVTDIAGGGVTIDYLNSGSYYPYVHNTDIGSFLNNNYRLYFDGYESTATDATKFGYRQFAIGLSRSSTATDNYRKFFKYCSGLRFDTVNGKVELVQGKSATDAVDVFATVITNDALKYDNFAGKPFTVDFINSDDDEIKVVVTIDNGEDVDPTVLEGAISRTTYRRLRYPLTTTYGYFTVSGLEHALGANPWTIDYYGWSRLPDPPTGLAEGLTVVATKDKEYNAWSNSARVVTDLAEGGVRVNWVGGYSGYAPYRLNANLGDFPREGMMFQFDKYIIDSSTTSSANGYGKILICLASTQANDATKIKKNTPYLEIDTVAGTLKLGHCKDPSFGTVEGFAEDQTIIESTNVLKYASIGNKPFTVTIKKDGAGNYPIEINVDGTPVSGVMSAEKFDAISMKPNAMATYMSVGGYENGTTNKWSIDFYGFKKIEVPAPVIDVSPLTETATVATDVFGGKTYKQVTDLTDGGVSINWPQYLSAYGPYGYSVNLGKFPGEHGFKLQFSNYKNNAAKTEKNAYAYGQIILILTSTTGNDHFKIKKDVPYLQIDTVNGKLYLGHCKDDKFGTEHGFTKDQEIISSDLLKAENFKNKAFSFTFKNSTTSEGDVDITVEVGGDGNLNKGQTVTGVLD